MECNHPAALHQRGSDGLTHCGICWAVVGEDKSENKPVEAEQTRTRAKRKPLRTAKNSV